jgi:SdpI/YfhL protein family
MEIYRLFFTGASLLVMALSVPMVRGRVEPNGWYGFRIPITLNNPEIWYPANRYAGWCLLVYAAILLVASLLLPLVPGTAFDGYALWMAGLALGGLVLVFLLSWRYARKLARDEGQEAAGGG